MTVAGDVDALVGAPAAGRARRTEPTVLLAVIGLGLATMVAGTFAPWLRSGTARRNSYTSDGVVRHFLSPDGTTHAILMVWPFLSALCAIAAALLLVGLVRTGCLLAAGCAAAVGIVSVRVLSTGSSAIVGVDRIGSVVTLTGCVIVVIGIVVFTVHQRLHRSKRG